MSLTEAQTAAVAARGNVLVVAGAGTGKTHTLVERCLACLLNEKPRASLDEILMVTFTEAAAAEMRQRIRSRLEEEMTRHFDDHHWREQLALFETAHIGTLHSFCLKLVREHFYQLELDPQLAVLAEEEAKLLADETLDTLFQRHYSGRGPEATAVQQLIQSQGRGWDKPIRNLVLRVHHYTQTLPAPAEWLQDQLKMFAETEPVVWRHWLADVIATWHDQWLPTLKGLSQTNDTALSCIRILQRLAQPNLSVAAACFLELVEAKKACPRGKKKLWAEPLRAFFAEAEFLSSLTRADNTTDPLAEDWAWVRPQMTTLLRLVRDFTANYSEAKHELGMVDFHDLEQHALQLLWDFSANKPTLIALEWRKKLKFVFVDEYQDINAAQDRIIQALGREGVQANRFLVGDAKQSIYRFRLANPQIFQGYARDWSGASGTVIPLADNFRSREKVLDFINSLFTNVMRVEAGGIPYDTDAALRFGARPVRSHLAAAGASPSVELHLRLRTRTQESADEDEVNEALEANNALAEVQDLDQADKDARLVAIRIRELHAEKHAVWDEEVNGFRPVEWRDVAVLLRSPSGKAESYAKEFARLNIPLQVARGGFYQSLEVSDLVSLLRTLDNPLQDIPVLAVLRSPLVGLTLNELAIIRLTAAKVHFWTALVRWKESRQKRQNEGTPEHRPESREEQNPSTVGERAPAMLDEDRTYEKVSLFLERFARWRRLARQVALSRCLEVVLSETHYSHWLLTQPRGEQRAANVQRFIGLAEQFDQFQRQGLFRFLRVIEAQQMAEVEPQVAAVGHENAVRLMSIHQSKGLEFPVVVVADLGKPFNLTDLRADIILDEQFGLCPQVKPPQTGSRYPSLPYWLARRRQIRELLGEEMRLLYVALTRARDTLILSGAISRSNLRALRSRREKPELGDVLGARNYADWIGLWFSCTCASGEEEAVRGANDLVRWWIHDDTKLASPVRHQDEEPRDLEQDSLAPELWRGLGKKLSWVYPFGAATTQPAKTSVSEVRRLVTEIEDEAETPFLSSRTHQIGGNRNTTGNTTRKPGLRKGNQGPSAADIGNAHHRFLQLVSLEKTVKRDSLEAEARRLLATTALTQEEIALLDFQILADFWESKLGGEIRARREFVKRELAFTTRFQPGELCALAGRTASAELDGEFVVVQGVADLVILLPEGLWLVDFKTDTVPDAALQDRVELYQPQITLYAQALSRIFRIPVLECWLCFLNSRQQIPVKVASSAS